MGLTCYVGQVEFNFGICLPLWIYLYLLRDERGLKKCLLSKGSDNNITEPLNDFELFIMSMVMYKLFILYFPGLDVGYSFHGHSSSCLTGRKHFLLFLLSLICHLF